MSSLLASANPEHLYAIVSPLILVFCKIGAPLIENLFIDGSLSFSVAPAILPAMVSSRCSHQSLFLRKRQAKLSGYVLVSPAGDMGIDLIVIFI